MADGMKPIGEPDALRFTQVQPCEMLDPKIAPTHAVIQIRAPNITHGENTHHGLFTPDELDELAALLVEVAETIREGDTG